MKAQVARSAHGMTDEQVQKSRLQFPICDTADAFDRAAKLAGTRPRALGLTF